MPSTKSNHNNKKRSNKKKPHSDIPPSATDIKLGKKLGLSKSEFDRYKQLDMLIQSMLTHKLQERHDLNQFVILHLGEKISPYQQFTALIKLLFPTEHALRYALQKVNNIEQEINQLLALHDTAPLFDENTTKKHRVELLLQVAQNYKQSLLKDLNTPHKHEQIQQKLKNLTDVITEFKTQLKTADFTIHNKTLFNLSDPDIRYLLSKLKAIGVEDTPKAEKRKSNTGFFHAKIISVFFNPEVKDKDKDTPSNDANRNKPL